MHGSILSSRVSLLATALVALILHSVLPICTSTTKVNAGLAQEKGVNESLISSIREGIVVASTAKIMSKDPANAMVSRTKHLHAGLREVLSSYGLKAKLMNIYDVESLGKLSVQYSHIILVMYGDAYLDLTCDSNLLQFLHNFDTVMMYTDDLIDVKSDDGEFNDHLITSPHSAFCRSQNISSYSKYQKLYKAQRQFDIVFYALDPRLGQAYNSYESTLNTNFNYTEAKIKIPVFKLPVPVDIVPWHENMKARQSLRIFFDVDARQAFRKDVAKTMLEGIELFRTKIDVNKALKHKDLTNLSGLSSPKGIVLETKLIREKD